MDIDVAAFVNNDELYKYNRMPFEIKNAAKTLQPAMDVLMATVKLQYVFVYIDDTTKLSRTPKKSPTAF